MSRLQGTDHQAQGVIDSLRVQYAGAGDGGEKKLKITAHDGNKWRGSDMRYQFKREVFVAKLPDDIAAAINCTHAEGATAKECEDDFKKQIKTWASTKLKKRRMIAYTFEASERPKLRKKKHDFRYNEDSETVRNDLGERVHGLTFQFSIGELIEYPDGRTNFAEEDGHRSYTHNQEMIEWTAEREAFCVSLCAAIDALVLRASAILDQDPNKFAALIASKGMSMLGLDPKP